MSEADDRYLAEIRRDCELILGPGITLLDVDVAEADRADEVRLTARYEMHTRGWETVGTGETIVAAHAALRARLLVDRIRLGFVTVVYRP